MNPDPPRGSARLLVLLAALHAALAAGWLLLRGPAYGPDGVSYGEMAGALLRGDLRGFLNATWSPALPIAVSPLVAFGLDIFPAASLVALLSGLAGIAALARLARVLRLGAPGAAFACAAFAVCPLWIAHSTVATPDMLCAPLFALWIAGLVRLSRDPSPRQGWRCGLGAGLLYWVRAYMIPFGLAALPVALLLAPRGSRLRAAAGYVAGLSVAAAPWVLALSLEYGGPTISSTAVMTRRDWVGEEFSRRPLAETACLYVPSGPGNLVDYMPPRHPIWDRPAPAYRIPAGRQAAVLARNLIGSARILANPGYGLGLLLLVLGIARAPDGAARREGLLLAALLPVYAAGYSAVHLVDRFLLPLLLPLLVLAGRGFEALGPRRALRVSVLALWGAATVVQGARRVEETRRLGYREMEAAYREAGGMIAAGGGGAVAAIGGTLRIADPPLRAVWWKGLAVAHFGGGRFAALAPPDAGAEAELRSRGVRWVVAERRRAETARLLLGMGFRRALDAAPAGDSEGFELWRGP